ncbi:predicted protein [Micromonas commoda]|uniref:Importin N-terminal domain-containing protein n=1 Tax=Micromonas commoda (strain RCC299 / NOUM17 / CCMP2709) TaxID=296587 RepID=C1EIK1_MICCC|nr:predicted protein [Micromonas commoda]ACO67875.1 predicted protein [Micromonas commoda]|eukprot:XP_002506617.1 predicted protein [Micromonas commoda]
MALADATNVVATDAPIATATKTMSQASEVPNAPNPEKLVAALDDVASFDAAKRDAAAAKLDAASAKDAPGLCIALLRVASDDAHGSARRLAAGTFARNLLRKAFWTPEKDGASFPDAYRAAVRVAALDALCVAPDGPSRALIAECLRLAGAVPASAIGGSSQFTDITSSSSEDPRADLALDVCERLAKRGSFAAAKHESSFVLSPGFLLATHAAARPFQYFRDAAKAREAAPEALETLCVKVIAPHVVPMCGCDDARVRRAALKVVFRVVRAYMPDALRGEVLRSIVASISRSTLILRARSYEGTASEEDWIAAKRALRLAKALVTRHASMLDSSAFLAIVGACVGAAGVEDPTADAADAAVAEAFACLESVLAATREPKPTSDAAWAGLTDLASVSGVGSPVGALKDLILECVVPHANLRKIDEERLAEDPEEYARVNAVGDVAIVDVIEEALADGGGSGSGVTARNAALEFVQALVTTVGPAVSPGAEPPAKKHKKDTKKDTKRDGEDGDGKAPSPTPGESALKDVVDAILAEAPKEKIEKVGKSAAAAGAVATYAAPAAEASLGASKYFGLFQLAASLASAQAQRGRGAKDGAMRLFCQRHAFPAAAATDSPHVAAAAAKFIADALVVGPRTSSAAPLLREGVAALIAAIEREWDLKGSNDDDTNDDDGREIDEEGVAAVKDIASWAAKSVLEDAPAASEAFGTLAVGAVDAACERLLALVESSPAHSTPALRVLGAMAGAASGAMTPTAAAGRIERIVAAFAPFAPSTDEEDDSIEGNDSSIDVPLDAWEASVDACAALVEAANAWDAPEGASEGAVDEAREGEMAAAAAAAAHVAAYWRAAESLEPSDDEDEEDEDTAGDGDETDGRYDRYAPPPAHAAVASLLRAAAEVLASSRVTDKKTANSARLAANVPRVCAEWARHLPAWRRQGEAGLVDDACLDDLRDIVAAVSTAGTAGDDAVAAIAGFGAATAAAVLEDSDDEPTRRAAAGALAACVSAPGFPGWSHVPGVPTFPLRFNLLRVALDNAEGATTGRRSARAALHLLAAVAASSGFAGDASFAQEWLRVRCECAGVAGWTVTGVDGALLGAHVASLHAALVALVAPGAPQPDKQVFGAALDEAVRAAATLLASPEDGCDEDDDDEEDEDDSDGEDDSDDEATINDGLENETEEEFLERYAAIARDMADGTADDELNDDDDEGCDEEDSAYQVAFEATRGDGSRDAMAFAAWFETWRAGDTRGVRVSSVVDGAAAKALAKAAAR